MEKLKPKSWLNKPVGETSNFKTKKGRQERNNDMYGWKVINNGWR